MTKLVSRVQGAAIIFTGLTIGGGVIREPGLAWFGFVCALVFWPTYAIVKAISERGA